MALNCASLKNSLSSYLQVVASRTDASADTINQHGEILRKVADLVDVVATKEADIGASKVLSAEGKSQALAELGTATAARLGFVGRKGDQLATDIRDTEASLFTVKQPANVGADPLPRFLYAKEIRDRYKDLSQQERDIAFLKAAEGMVEDPDDEDHDAVVAQVNRDAIVWAMQQAPLPMITKDIMTRALADRARRLNPETFAHLGQVKILHEMVGTLRDSLVQWLRALGGDKKKIYDELGGEPPPVSPMETARKMVNA